MRAPALRKPAQSITHNDDASTIDQNTKSCPFACLKYHHRLYLRGSDHHAATLCLACGTAFSEQEHRRHAARRRR